MLAGASLLGSPAGSRSASPEPAESPSPWAGGEVGPVVVAAAVGTTPALGGVMQLLVPPGVVVPAPVVAASPPRATAGPAGTADARRCSLRTAAVDARRCLLRIASLFHISLRLERGNVAPLLGSPGVAPSAAVVVSPPRAPAGAAAGTGNRAGVSGAGTGAVPPAFWRLPRSPRYWLAYREGDNKLVLRRALLNVRRG